MTLDGRAVANFYQGNAGAVVRDRLRERLARLWPDMRGRRVLGLGHARPYLGLWQDDARSCIDLTDAAPADGPWCPAGTPASVVADGDALPFEDLTVDRILLVHGLEVAHDARRLIRECWRVLRDDGALLVVAPNRVGVWAHVEATPFGQGAPYTEGQVARLLAAGMFAVQRRDQALFLPPIENRVALRMSPMVERVGRRLAPRFAGVVIAEAVKDVYAAVPLRAVGRRRVMQSGAALPRLHAARASGNEGTREAGQPTPEFTSGAI